MIKSYIFILLGILLSVEVCAEQAYFDVDDLHQYANSGYIQLQWNADNGASEYWLEQSQDSLFMSSQLIYQGPDQASFVSGLEDGHYYYRVKTAGSSWSNVLSLTVKHQSLQLALSLAGVGMLVFGLTTVVIIKGSHTTTSEA
ncbi:hypothetical protein N6H18_15215 [Reichenbachiella agarivorans]|uniref:Two component regulator three Y domain-containing protein n=1 Tax=Reichenbachiella agarivorans TaxID=2979464 RepID=A0ABY6CMF8_9BACT|nr:hypothetical protein [Reichenbachiella agarivorans]UXP31698.1 hypothetical protein N6H18_15215 [Reichenbachiella agarivorans]